MNLNVVTLVGRVGQDGEAKYFESGRVLYTTTLAVNRRKSGDQPDWFNLQIWGKTAEVAINYVRKGSLVGITGQLTIESWTDKNTGADRSKPVIRVDRLELLGSKRDNESDSGYSDEFQTDG